MTNLYRVRTEISQNPGNPMLGTHYFGTSADPSDSMSFVADFWGDLASIVKSDVRFAVSPEIDTINADNGELVASLSATPVDPVPGSSTSEPLPPATQALMQLHTGVILGGRKIVGRIFVPGMTESSSDTGVPDTGVHEAVQTAAQNLIDASGSTWCVWSRKNKAGVVISSATCWDLWAVQRKRRS